MIKIVDSHHHLWNPDSDEPHVGYVWLKVKGAIKPFGDPSPIQRDYLIDEFRAEYEEISASIHIQSDGGLKDPVAETKFIQKIADKEQFFIGIVGFVDLSSDSAENIIVKHQKSENFRGVRQILSKIDRRPDLSFANIDYIRSPTWRENFGLLREHSLSFDLQLYPEQMLEVAEFLSKHEDIKVVIDHAGSPYDMSERGRKLWSEGMGVLSEFPEIRVKASGLGMFDKEWNEKNIAFIMESLIKMFGEKRVMFGSNFPVDKIMRSYGEIVDHLGRFFNDQNRDDFFANNANRFYRVGRWK